MTDTSFCVMRALAAEFIGTFALIFIGAGAAIALGINHVRLSRSRMA
jgi:glycerol uptake facilitator-like aquaporin